MATLDPQIRQQIQQAKLDDPSVSSRTLGRVFNLNASTIQKYWTSSSQTTTTSTNPSSPAQETIDMVGDKMTITKVSRISDLEGLIAHFKVDRGIWEVERWKANKWDMAMKPPATTEYITTEDGREIPAWVRFEKDPIITELYQVTATFTKKKHIVDARAEIEILKAEAKLEMRFPKPVIYTTQDSANMLELLMPDLHAAKLAWSKETGFKNYDTHIAVDTYRRAMDRLIQSASSVNLDKIILGVGNDLLQADNIQGTTYSGTKVDVDSRYRKTYVTVRKMMSEAVEKLRLIAPVEVKVVPGNHDTLSAFTLGDSLECKFENYSDVLVDNAPIQHKIVEWGDVFLILTHGHNGKQSDYGIWMASQYPKEFGRTKFREIHVGHKHKTALDEKFGVRVRTFSALCEPDEWHATNLFVGNLKVAEGLVFNKFTGLTSHFYHTEVD
jgi:hypothetical protein